MGFRFFRRFRILPGITLNLSRSGPSVSIGPRGMKVTYGPKGKRQTVGLPGTGLFYTETEKYDAAKDVPPGTNGRFLRVLFYVMLAVFVFFIVKVMLAH
ncbi:MAG: DUF4236 domain-containing protein [Thermodesulfovibrionales bacterium]|jgi:hypothetical protein